VDSGWQAESGLRFLLELQMQRRQCRAEAERSRRQQHVLHRGMISSGLGDCACKKRRSSIPKPQSAESLPASSDLLPQQLIAGSCVLLERRLIREVGRTLGGDHARGGTASYSFGSDKSGNLGIAIVVRHDLSLRAGENRENCAILCCPFLQNWIWHSRVKVTSYFT
jgi:hypothetical protein